MRDYTVPVFADLEGVPDRKGKWHRKPIITDDEVRDMRRMHDVDMKLASQVHAEYPQFSLQHIVRILDRKARADVADSSKSIQQPKDERD